MRIPLRLQSKAVPTFELTPKVEPTTEPFRNVYFLNCVRCMGHGYFWTDPPQVNPTVVFSKEMATAHLIHLWENNLVSTTQAQVLGDQITTSNLPAEIPPIVEEFVRECIQWEVAVEKLSTGDPEASVCSVKVGLEVAEAVHEFLLGERGRPELKAQ